MKDALKELFPPEVPPVVRWRLAIFLSCAVFLIFIFWSLSPYGFALASEQAEIRDNVTDMRLGQLEQQIYDGKQSECIAQLRSPERRFFANRVMELARKYRELAGSKADIPPCARGEQE